MEQAAGRERQGRGRRSGGRREGEGGGGQFIQGPPMCIRQGKQRTLDPAQEGPCGLELWGLQAGSAVFGQSQIHLVLGSHCT